MLLSFSDPCTQLNAVLLMPCLLQYRDIWSWRTQLYRTDTCQDSSLPNSLHTDAELQFWDWWELSASASGPQRLWATHSTRYQPLPATSSPKTSITQSYITHLYIRWQLFLYYKLTRCALCLWTDIQLTLGTDHSGIKSSHIIIYLIGCRKPVLCYQPGCEVLLGLVLSLLIHYLYYHSYQLHTWTQVLLLYLPLVAYVARYLWEIVGCGEPWLMMKQCFQRRTSFPIG